MSYYHILRINEEEFSPDGLAKMVKVVRHMYGLGHNPEYRDDGFLKHGIRLGEDSETGHRGIICADCGATLCIGCYMEVVVEGKPRRNTEHGLEEHLVLEECPGKK